MRAWLLFTRSVRESVHSADFVEIRHHVDCYLTVEDFGNNIYIDIRGESHQIWPFCFDAIESFYWGFSTP